MHHHHDLGLLHNPLQQSTMLGKKGCGCFHHWVFNSTRVTRDEPLQPLSVEHTLLGMMWIQYSPGISSAVDIAVIVGSIHPGRPVGVWAQCALDAATAIVVEQLQAGYTAASQLRTHISRVGGSLLGCAWLMMIQYPSGWVMHCHFNCQRAVTNSAGGAYPVECIACTAVSQPLWRNLITVLRPTLRQRYSSPAVPN